MINSVEIMGRLGSDAQMRQTPRGSVLTFSIATKNSWKDAGGNWQSETQWHDVSAYNKDYLADKLKKGELFYIEGKFKSYVVDNERRHEISARTVKHITAEAPQPYSSPQDLLPPEPLRGGWGQG